MADETIVVMGGTGFVGRYVVNRLVAAGLRVIIPTRRRENAQHLNVLPTANIVEVDVNRAGEAVSGYSRVRSCSRRVRCWLRWLWC